MIRVLIHLGRVPHLKLSALLRRSTTAAQHCLSAMAPMAMRPRVKVTVHRTFLGHPILLSGHILAPASSHRICNPIRVHHLPGMLLPLSDLLLVLISLMLLQVRKGGLPSLATRLFYKTKLLILCRITMAHIQYVFFPRGVLTIAVFGCFGNFTKVIATHEY